MLVDVMAKWVTEVNPANPGIQELVRHKGEKNRVKVDLRMLKPAEIDKLVAVANASKGAGYKVLAQAVELYRMLKDDATGGKPVTELAALVPALIAYIKPAENHWLFREENGNLMAYYVSGMEYTPPRRYMEDEEPRVTPGYVSVSLRTNGEGGGITFHDRDLVKEDGKWRTTAELLNREGYYLETPEMVARYKAEIEAWHNAVNNTGAQYNARGVGFITSGGWYRSMEEVSMERNGRPTKVVIDDPENEEEDNNRSRRNRSRTTRVDTSGKVVSNAFWVNIDKPEKQQLNKEQRKKMSYSYRHSHDDEDDVDLEDPNATVVLPHRPFLHVFDLEKHQFVSIHINNLEPYPYDETLGDKLILPEDTLDMLYALVRGADNVLEDIVQGKTGGTIVIATGPPGTGKTLTAEMFSEIVRKPLYTIQCSQLGTDGESLEKELGIVLARAQRWKAILLIDEADVYVRARGADIQQNAIVGIWLRILEYYRGILFMTSNRDVEIDDAVMSRATAWVKYDFPTHDDLAKIWRVLAEQYGMKLDGVVIDELINRWPQLTGRNVKNMIKLSLQLSKTRKAKNPLDLFERAARFLAVPPPKSTDEEDDKRILKDMKGVKKNSVQVGALASAPTSTSDNGR